MTVMPTVRRELVSTRVWEEVRDARQHPSIPTLVKDPVMAGKVSPWKHAKLNVTIMRYQIRRVQKVRRRSALTFITIEIGDVTWQIKHASQGEELQNTNSTKSQPRQKSTTPGTRFINEAGNAAGPTQFTHTLAENRVTAGKVSRWKIAKLSVN